MRRAIRWSLIVVLAIDVAVVAAFLAGGSPLRAEAAADRAGTAAEDGGSPSALAAESLRVLGDELRARQTALERREAELEELLRADTVLARAGLSAPDGPDDETIAEERDAAEAAAESAARRASAFASLAKAYENMEPDSAASALAELAGRDRQAVIDLLLGWPPRTSGAILDALTQADAALAAQLSYEIWSIGGERPAP